MAVPEHPAALKYLVLGGARPCPSSNVQTVDFECTSSPRYFMASSGRVEYAEAGLDRR